MTKLGRFIARMEEEDIPKQVQSILINIYLEERQAIKKDPLIWGPLTTNSISGFGVPVKNPKLN